MVINFDIDKYNEYNVNIWMCENNTTISVLEDVPIKDLKTLRDAIDNYLK